MQEYVKMKLRLVENCKKNDTVVFNEDDDILKSIFHDSPFKKINIWNNIIKSYFLP